MFHCFLPKKKIKIKKIEISGAENKSKLNKIMSLAEQPTVSRYGERRSRHKSGQSDTSSVCTVSTTQTNQSEPIPTNSKIIFEIYLILYQLKDKDFIFNLKVL